jgi:hypothetical protein
MSMFGTINNNNPAIQELVSTYGITEATAVLYRLAEVNAQFLNGTTSEEFRQQTPPFIFELARLKDECCKITLRSGKVIYGFVDGVSHAKDFGKIPENEVVPVGKDEIDIYSNGLIIFKIKDILKINLV